jgi:Skp family chaperone for outer membrane proteins
MRRLVFLSVVGLLGATPLYAQVPDLAAPAQAPAAPQPAVEDVPFPAEARYGVIDVQRIFVETALGQSFQSQVLALQQQRVNELNERNLALQASQQKLEAGGGVLSLQAITQLQREIERQQLDLQRFSEDAQVEVQELQQELFTDFEVRLSPVIELVFEEQALWLLFDAAATGLILSNPALDLTSEVIERFDSANPGTGAPAAPVTPATPAAP